MNANDPGLYGGNVHGCGCGYGRCGACGTDGLYRSESCHRHDGPGYGFQIDCGS